MVALEYGLERLATLPLSLRLVREMHERLMRDVRGRRHTRGVPPQSELDRTTWMHAERRNLHPSASIRADELSGRMGEVPL